MRTILDVAQFVGDQPHLMGLIRTVATLGVDDCWIGAGAIRNAVWDHLHGYPAGLVSGSDVDVVYCDHRDIGPERDRVLERRLMREGTGIPWSVHNQARMHGRNGDAPYRDTGDAVRCWPETATAIAARLHGGHVQIIAPHGVDDLVGMIVRPTPAFVSRLAVYQRRLASRDWSRWPRLTFL